MCPGSQYTEVAQWEADTILITVKVSKPDISGPRHPLDNNMRTCAVTSLGGEGTRLRLRRPLSPPPSGVRASGAGLSRDGPTPEGRAEDGAWPPGRAPPPSSGLRWLRAHPPPFFCGPAHCEGDRKPCAGSAAILDQPEEDPEGAAGAATATTAPAAGASATSGQLAFLPGLGRRIPAALPPRPHSASSSCRPPPVRKAAQPPATPQVTEAFRSGRPVPAPGPGPSEGRRGAERWAGGAPDRPRSGPRPARGAAEVAGLTALCGASCRPRHPARLVLPGCGPAPRRAGRVCSHLICRPTGHGRGRRRPGPRRLCSQLHTAPARSVSPRVSPSCHPRALVAAVPPQATSSPPYKRQRFGIARWLPCPCRSRSVVGDRVGDSWRGPVSPCEVPGQPARLTTYTASRNNEGEKFWVS